MYIDGIQTKFKKFLYEEKENKNKEKIVKYVFDHNLKRLDYMFFLCYNITSVKFVNVDISLVKSKESMLSSCLELKSVDLRSSFNSKNLINIVDCFHYCPNLEEIDISYLDFSNVEEYGYIFGRSFSIEKIVISKQNKEKFKEIFEFMDANIECLKK